MANLLGPNAFGASNSSATRPANTPDDSGSDTWFKDCTSATARDGTQIKAAQLNTWLALFRSLIRGGSVTEANADDAMLLRAVRSQRMNWLTVGGTANALTLTPSPAFASLSDLVGVPLRFLTGASANTGAVTLAVSGLTATAVTRADGAALAEGDLPAGRLILVMYDGSAFRVLAGVTAGSSDFLRRSFRNLLINGDLAINQRVFAGGALSAGVYGYDRWKASGAGCSVSVASGTVTLTGTIEQVIEAPSLASTSVTVSVGDPSADIGVDVAGVTGTITAGSGRRSVTLALGSGVTGNVSVKLSAGTSRTFKDAQLEVGSTATPFERRQIGMELLLCQRYFAKGWRLETAPGTTYAGGAGFQDGWVTAHWPTHKPTNYLGSVDAWLPVEMRATPTVTWYDAAGTANKFSAYSTASGARTDGRTPYSGLSGAGNGRRKVTLWSYTEIDTYGIVANYTADAEI